MCRFELYQHISVVFSLHLKNFLVCRFELYQPISVVFSLHLKHFLVCRFELYQPISVVSRLWQLRGGDSVLFVNKYSLNNYKFALDYVNKYSLIFFNKYYLGFLSLISINEMILGAPEKFGHYIKSCLSRHFCWITFRAAKRCLSKYFSSVNDQDWSYKQAPKVWHRPNGPLSKFTYYQRMHTFWGILGPWDIRKHQILTTEKSQNWKMVLVRAPDSGVTPSHLLGCPRACFGPDLPI